LDPVIAGEVLAEEIKPWEVLRLETFVTACYRDIMTKQTTLRLPDDLADQVEAIARTEGISVNQLVISSIELEIARVRADKGFNDRLKKLVQRDKAILDRLAK